MQMPSGAGGVIAEQTQSGPQLLASRVLQVGRAH
jgi:hypothetical protein